MDKLSDEELSHLVNEAPKIRPCLIDGGVEIGRNKLQGRCLNSAAPKVFATPRGNRTRQAHNLAASKQTIVYKGKTYSLFKSKDQYENILKDISRLWRQQSALAEKLIGADSEYCDTEGRDLAILVLKMANWKVSHATETFRSYDDIRNAPHFVSTVTDTITATVMDMLQTPEAEAMYLAQVTGPEKQVDNAKRFAIDFFMEGHRDTKDRLQNLAESLQDRTGHGVVNEVLSWYEAASSPEKFCQPNFGEAAVEFGVSDKTEIVSKAEGLRKNLKRGREETDEVGGQRVKRMRHAPPFSHPGNSVSQPMIGTDPFMTYGADTGLLSSHPEWLTDATTSQPNGLQAPTTFNHMEVDMNGTSMRATILTSVPGSNNNVSGLESFQQFDTDLDFVTEPPTVDSALEGTLAPAQDIDPRLLVNDNINELVNSGEAPALGKSDGESFLDYFENLLSDGLANWPDFSQIDI
jgi:hypothetical protein